MSTTILQDSKAFPFALNADVWKHYLRSRPAYPDPLWHEWLDYHQGPLETAHELGTGCGIGAAGLLSAARARGRPIRHMILSDPSESNVATSRELLLGESGEAGEAGGGGGHHPGTRLSFHRQRGEDSFLGPGSVDLALACECLHFTDIEETVASVHASLRPGGTVAAVFYGARNWRVRDGERAAAAWRAFEGMHLRRVSEEGIETALAHIRPSQVGVGLNFVPLGRDLWRDVRRIFVNVPDGQTGWPAAVGEPRDGVPTGRSRIDPDHDRLEWRRDEDGWAIKDCTAERVKESLVSLLLGYGDTDWQSDEWREFEDAVTEGGGTVNFVIPATMILARKK